jgi:hypothetical protein
MTDHLQEPEQSPPVFFRYRLKFSEGGERVFTVNLDPDTLALRLGGGRPPAWTRLEFHQCPNCPLEPARHPECPVAVGLIELISFLEDLTSYTEIGVVVETRERNYTADSTLQRVAGSLMGIYMVTCGCPILDKMRPMVETHLPFSTWEETVYRVMSMYLLAQYFRIRNGLEPAWDLAGLVGYYDEVQTVNVEFANRLRGIPSLHGDAGLNAISLLSSLATMASMSIKDHDLQHWERIFMAHWG